MSSVAYFPNDLGDQCINDALPPFLSAFLSSLGAVKVLLLNVDLEDEELTPREAVDTITSAATAFRADAETAETLSNLWGKRMMSPVPIDASKLIFSRAMRIDIGSNKLDHWHLNIRSSPFPTIHLRTDHGQSLCRRRDWADSLAHEPEIGAVWIDKRFILDAERCCGTVDSVYLFWKWRNLEHSRRLHRSGSTIPAYSKLPIPAYLQIRETCRTICRERSKGVPPHVVLDSRRKVEQFVKELDHAIQAKLGVANLVQLLADLDLDLDQWQKRR